VFQRHWWSTPVSHGAPLIWPLPLVN
jgi:hypothetical protein